MTLTEFNLINIIATDTGFVIDICHFLGNYNHTEKKTGEPIYKWFSRALFHISYEANLVKGVSYDFKPWTIDLLFFNLIE